VAPESADTIRTVESALGSRLPVSLVWLLCEHGYSDACGVASLQGCVTDTLRCRRTINLPDGYILLNDWGDGGVVLLDARKLDCNGDCPVVWTDVGAVQTLSESGQLGRDPEFFEGFAEWSQSRLDQLRDE